MELEFANELKIYIDSSKKLIQSKEEAPIVETSPGKSKAQPKKSIRTTFKEDEKIIPLRTNEMEEKNEKIRILPEKVVYEEKALLSKELKEEKIPLSKIPVNTDQIPIVSNPSKSDNPNPIFEENENKDMKQQEMNPILKPNQNSHPSSNPQQLHLVEYIESSYLNLPQPEVFLKIASNRL